MMIGHILVISYRPMRGSMSLSTAVKDSVISEVLGVVVPVISFRTMPSTHKSIMNTVYSMIRRPKSFLIVPADAKAAQVCLLMRIVVIETVVVPAVDFDGFVVIKMSVT